jgi:hypothetical protein
VAGFRLAEPGLHRTVALARRTDVEPTSAAHEFRETLLEHIRSEAEAGTLPTGVRSLVA